MNTQKDLTCKFKKLCLFLQNQKDPESGIIHLVDNLSQIATKFELGVEAVRNTLKVFYTYHKLKLSPINKGFYPNCEVLEKEYHYQGKLIAKRHENQIK